MSPLPLPVRVAAGLVASAVEQARDLPRLAVEFPVTAVSQALQASMRMQQKVTELAIKGDQALGALRPVEERPSWATFDDEDEEPLAGGRNNGASTVTELRPPREPRSETPADADVDTAVETGAEATATDETAGGPAPTGEPDASGPNVLPGYATMTIPQLRGRLRFLSADELHTLLEWETAHGNRPPFVTMLSNRITTVTEG
ncbi:lipid droplet-associated protein [Pseudonocardia sp. MH-G8]|uniref:lipid droplet-associated protein n=1 Tax=Pseudonocardia sp. MH-G8 TaxID=1854588 RepID=UPI000BA0BC80|nr:lipid droplet-associated protein [Pseudonocardia sp. MH-G8]OZM83808.1 hypothetical protein CFP66_04920 [Pseudonocardia sp. MH-G8]